MNYQKTKRLDLVETLHGVRVADPYRWLEDAENADTRAWVDAENALTRSVLDGPARAALVQRLAACYDYPRTTSLARRGGREFFTHNPGLLNQPILYVRAGGGTESAEPRVLIDPNALAPDGTTALTAYFPSPDGALVVYALSAHGSDRQELRVRDTGTLRDHPDRIVWVKFASVAWTRDAAGFFYLRFPEPGSVAAEDEHYFGRIYFHRLGTPQAEDPLVFETPDQKDVVPLVDVSHSGRWVVVTAQRGASDEAEVYVAAESTLTRKPEGEGWKPSFKPLFTGFRSAYHFVEESDGRLVFRTTDQAPKGRIVSVDPEHSGEVRELVPECDDRLSLAAIAGDRIVASYLHNASDRVRAFDQSGRPEGELPLPGVGSIVTLDATPDDPEVRVVWTSFVDPPSAWIIQGRQISGLTAGAAPRRASSAYRTRQVWYESKDGTRVSMFLVHRADLPIDGTRSVLLSGYGGFNISRTPLFDPGNLPFLENGGVFALANLRGGGEYGEAWHRAGMLEKKQNVFDDFIAAAEYLVSAGYTTPDRIAIEGGSNGGLLVAAVMLQRPDLVGAVVCRVPVADMLRYHLFTVGRFWIPEYGSADDPEQFRFLLKYSPYHNIRSGVRYPPTLVMTADTDDRVSPGMAKKFAARLQAEAEGGPFLIRVETKAGHGMGKPVTKLIDEDADILAFMETFVRAATEGRQRSPARSRNDPPEQD
jgi:prolyl oligopeptidase